MRTAACLSMPYGPQQGRVHLIKSGWEPLSASRLGKEALEGGGSSDSTAKVQGMCPPPDAGMAVLGIRVWKQLTYERKKGWWHFRKLVDGCHGVRQDRVLET